MKKKLEIKSHNFENSKNQLKKFSEAIPSQTELPTVADKGGLLGWFDHKVTGDELNVLTNKVQEHLINNNKLLVQFFKEFGQVYNTFEALDKEYIQIMITAIKAAEEASNQAENSASKAEKNTVDIKKMMKAQDEIIEHLTVFKNKIEKYKHLKNIDKMWTDNQNIKKDIASLLTDNKNNCESQMGKLSKQVKILWILAISSTSIVLIIAILKIINII